jgi:tellurite resistance protein TehA-like permease
MFTEPATMLTDYGLGILSALFSRRLWKAGQVSTNTSISTWAVGMGALAVASFAGGTVHGFSMVLAEFVLQGLWKATAYAIGLASCCFLAGTMIASVPKPRRQWLILVSLVQFVGYAVWMATHDEFRYVIYNYGVTLSVILFAQIYQKVVRNAPSAGWIVAGILVSFLGALVQQSGLTLHPSFNHNDLYHVVQMAGMVLLYRGASLLQDR